MTHDDARRYAPGLADAGAQIARLLEVLRLVELFAERTGQPKDEPLLDLAARISTAYDNALPIVQRRFDTLAAETAGWAAAGAQALLTLRERGRPVGAAARCLSDELVRAIRLLSLILAV